MRDIAVLSPGMTLPRPLFSEGGRPPDGSLEVYLPAPASLALLGEKRANDLKALYNLQAIYEDAVMRATAYLAAAAMGGPVVRRPRLGLYLQITAETHTPRLTDTGIGWHAHLYISPHGRNIADGTPHSSRLLDLALAAHETYLDSRAWLQVATEHYLRARWAVPPGLEQAEIVMARATAKSVQFQQLVLCRGEYGPLTRIKADDPYLTTSSLVDQAPPVLPG